MLAMTTYGFRRCAPTRRRWAGAVSLALLLGPLAAWCDSRLGSAAPDTDYPRLLNWAKRDPDRHPS